MDFFFEGLQSTSESRPKTDYVDSQMAEESHDLLKSKTSSVGITETQEPHTSSSIDGISRRVQDLVEKINDSRTRDQEMMDNFQEKLVSKVTEMFQQMKENIFTVYEENSSVMQIKLQELSEVLESCTELNKELMEASQALKSLREGLAISQAAEP
ncbi:synaptonemal complex central element protein 2 [Notolabrus celidotus]|uniref:synaptonemal complex central element protein 2 n=1 Tax=Notolabrus celidotus TaxID=1203425 RepID=UPI00148FCE3B|nr:synaptonemal complex central element protein 2 [Notolabrus celidotus]XP_034544232.1 synaptonemal complex central element protein 2 [Notolabrus celidotus]XP_034544233.1 synaptonemal complex central element protein 2 [Notolabrus celidotus]XP_034544235.1 synaptonemal complex central element protein 2 [Notolabrus celidotus]